MRHLKARSVAPAQLLEEKQGDPFGAIFFQIWASVFFGIIGKGLSQD